MDDRTLTYYNRELTYIRKMGAEFSEHHPKIAGRLRLDQDSIEDPHVSRLIESFAFLTARIRQTIDDSFPELTESLIGILFPAYQAPFPSLSVIKCHAIPQVPKYQLIEKGKELIVRDEDNQQSRFKLCDDIHVLPIVIDEVKFSPLPVVGPVLTEEISQGKQTKAVLKIKIKPLSSAKLVDIEQDSIRFYINTADHISHTLIDYLSTELIGACLCANDGNSATLHLGAEDIVFPEMDLLKAGDLPRDGRNSAGYEALTYFFIFPQKFLFFDIKNIADAWQLDEEGFTLYLHFSHDHAELSQGLDTLSLQTGCAPIINLYQDSTEPTNAKLCSGEQKILINQVYQKIADVHSIVNVVAESDHGEAYELTPFYGEHKRVESDKPRAYWHLRRENSSIFNGIDSEGTDSYLSLVDPNFSTFTPNKRWIIRAEALCTNRDLPSKLPFGPNQPQFMFAEGGGGLRLKCLTPPTKTYQPKLNQESRWQLVNQLTLQNLSAPDGLDMLRMILSLVDLKQSRDTQAAIDAIQSFEIVPIVERVNIGGRAAICTGSNCIVFVNEKAFSGNSAYLFGKVLHKFFTNICVMNSFVKTSLCTGASKEPVYHWQTTLGDTDLL